MSMLNYWNESSSLAINEEVIPVGSIDSEPEAVLKASDQLQIVDYNINKGNITSSKSVQRDEHEAETESWEMR